MPYFTAVIAADGRGWRARDVDVSDATNLDDAAESLRGAAIGGNPVVAVLEREDEWFALVRVDGDDDPRVFVSDLAAASRSRFADLLAPAADMEVEDDGDEPDEDAEADAAAAAVDDGEPMAVSEPEPPGLATWAGDPDLLDDLGVPGRRLRALTEAGADDPAGVLAEVGDQAGFGELLEALR